MDNQQIFDSLQYSKMVSEYTKWRIKDAIPKKYRHRHYFLGLLSITSTFEIIIIELFLIIAILVAICYFFSDTPYLATLRSMIPEILPYLIILSTIAVLVRLITLASGYPTVIDHQTHSKELEYLANLIRKYTPARTAAELSDLISFLEYRKTLVESYQSSHAELVALFLAALVATYRLTIRDRVESAISDKGAIIISVIICALAFIPSLFKKFKFMNRWSDEDEFLLQGIKAVKVNHTVLGFD